MSGDHDELSLAKEAELLSSLKIEFGRARRPKNRKTKPTISRSQRKAKRTQQQISRRKNRGSSQ